MARKVTITLDDEILDFVDALAARGARRNRSGLINQILALEKRRALNAELEAAYRRDAADTAYRAEAESWDTVVGDGLHA